MRKDERLVLILFIPVIFLILNLLLVLVRDVLLQRGLIREILTTELARVDRA